MGQQWDKNSARHPQTKGLENPQELGSPRTPIEGHVPRPPDRHVGTGTKGTVTEKLADEKREPR
eukprot:scaffold101421_cov73-Attheya_sp.AAC.1